MKVLVYGAGVIGCYLAHALCAAGNDVTLLARGEWKRQLEARGLVIHHKLQRTTTVDHPNIVEAPGNAAYDAVFAVMQHQQMARILDDLARADSPLVVLVGNNMSAPEMEARILERSNAPKAVLFGFQGTAGCREAERVVCVHYGGGSMSLGGLHCEASDALKAKIAGLFAGTKYHLTWMPDMDAWYRCHLAFILPVACVCYATGCDLRRSTRAQRRQIVDATAEGEALLKALGYPILPPGEEAYYRPGPKRAMLAAMLFAMAKTVVGDLAASDHCRHAVAEMEGLDAAWEEMRAKLPGFSMPNWDALRTARPDWQALRRLYGANGSPARRA